MHQAMNMSRNRNCTILWDNLKKVEGISHGMGTKTLRVSVLMLLDAILMGVVVVIGAYAPRYRRHPVIGAVFMGAITLFLPIVSIIVTNIDSVHDLIQSLLRDVRCNDKSHLNLVFAWTGVVVAIGVSASAVVAGDAREGRNIAPPTILLVKASWSAYLTFSTLYYPRISLIQLFVVMFAKLLLKYAAFYMAQRSFALGRSPRLIAGYMAQLTDTAPPAPALIFMGEDKVQVEEQPHGYNFKQMPDDNLVTLDRVWGLDDRDKDLCYAFALFKLLRCRFAKYTVSEAGFIKTSEFFRNTLLQDDGHYGRVFRIITDELSFINDYYYSSLPIYYSHPLLPAFGVTLSLWSIGSCLWLIVDMMTQGLFIYGDSGQINCWVNLLNTQDCGYNTTVFGPYGVLLRVGSLYYDIVPLYLAIAVLVFAEAREIVSYVCSNWSKVALICHHVNQACWQRSRVVQKCICSLLKYHKCDKLVNNWEDKMKQCSILVLRPRKTPLLLHRLLRSVGRGKKVEVQSTVKDAIFKALKNHGAVSCIGPPPSPVPLSQDVCSGRQPGYTILVWHIATSVFEVFYQNKTSVLEVMSQLPQPSESDHKTVATHLSRYCTYLVTSRPELLPDDAEWCRKLYDQVKKDADRRVLAKVQGVDLYDVLRAHDNHEVLRDGARLGKKLVDDSSTKGKGWEKLACFWVEMILYVAPSENLEAHAEAISHGGELITLLWAMLAHAGITGRLDDAGAAAAAEEEGLAE
ncbi:uncharacterized protein LOC120644975 [Panicum virgatum]|nr:uncharacterized protein LOC120644975 [Panicum virgatum]